MYGVIGEDRSDVETLKVIIRKLAKNENVQIKSKGYGSCGEMLRKGATQLKAFEKLNCTRFIACYDSDRATAKDRKKELIEKVFTPAALSGECCALVPIQELESWILADLKAVTNVIKSWRPENEEKNPEKINDPKEYLEKLSRKNHRPLYSHATHNPIVAKYLDLDKVHERCISFHPLAAIVQNGKGNLRDEDDS